MELNEQERKSKLNRIFFLLGLWLVMALLWGVGLVLFSENLFFIGSFFLFLLAYATTLFFWGAIGLNKKPLDLIVEFGRSKITQATLNIVLGFFVTCLVMTISVQFDEKFIFDLRPLHYRFFDTEQFSYLTKLPQRVDVVFYGSLKSRSENASLFKNLGHFKSRINLRFVDADLNPYWGRQFQIKSTPVLVVRSESELLGNQDKKDSTDFEVLPAPFTPNRFLKTLNRVLYSSNQRLICWADNLGGPRATSTAPFGASSFFRFLDEQGHTIVRLAHPSGLKSCETLVLWGPFKRDMLADWQDPIESYSGNLLIASASAMSGAPLGVQSGENSGTDFTETYPAWLQKIVEKGPVQFVEGLALDQNSTRVGLNVNEHLSSNTVSPRGQNLNLKIYLKDAKQILFNQNQKGWKGQVLLTTSKYPWSWLETNYRKLQQGSSKFDQNKDLPGPNILGLAIEKSAISKSPAKSKTGLLGPSSRPVRHIYLASDQLIQNRYAYNRDNFVYLKSLLDWLSYRDDVDEKREALGEQFFLNRLQVDILYYVGLLVIPLGLFSLGAFIWFRRRLD